MAMKSLEVSEERAGLPKRRKATLALEGENNEHIEVEFTEEALASIFWKMIKTAEVPQYDYDGGDTMKFQFDADHCLWLSKGGVNQPYTFGFSGDDESVYHVPVDFRQMVRLCWSFMKFLECYR